MGRPAWNAPNGCCHGRYRAFLATKPMRRHLGGAGIYFLSKPPWRGRPVRVIYAYGYVAHDQLLFIILSLNIPGVTI
jgi:hypothetical protein